MKWIAIVATSYCLSGTMADGSHTRAGSAANNWYPLGTKITISPPFLGRRRWVIRDRIGYGTQLDLWAPSCGQSIQFGRRTIKFHVGWPKKKRRYRSAQAHHHVQDFRWGGSYGRLLLPPF